MVLNQIIQKAFNLLGFTISRLRKKDVSPVIGEAKQFLWLKEFDLKTIIDIGANEGQFAEKILTVVPDASLHCFEPISSVYEVLKKNLAKYPSVTCYNFGLGESESEMDIFLNEYSPSSSLLPMLDLHKKNFDFAVNVTPDRIKIRTLDSFYADRIESPLLVKIDVQGYEMFVLKGGNKVIEQADVIIIETTFHPLYDGQPLFHDIYSYLLDKGFAYAGNVEQLISPKDNSILQADAVFIKSSSRKD